MELSRPAPHRRRLLPVLAIALAAALAPAVARAQVPPHTPGTICFTATFWCWALYPGYPGTPCECPTYYGWVPGILG
ncbi:hypothetical protein [Pseudoruegeria sp. SHC-113]|uniref:hypothetical protein n=1 Tax=Pseudoruegeria sp. SHC-113 TaxID=2855439 RepID=UPI0021BB0706|nr:hypothetical protein [Pseudoruegeria sp. SHC-113]MCT8158989.1 hypothetical protein [Pseudoruegeria sp. SHC-113]